MHLKLEELAKKLAAGYTDKEIMQALNFKRRSFYYHNAKVCKIVMEILQRKRQSRC
jgi:DNA-binding CsgD family transcriptional regulator